MTTIVRIALGGDTFISYLVNFENTEEACLALAKDKKAFVKKVMLEGKPDDYDCLEEVEISGIY